MARLRTSAIIVTFVAVLLTGCSAFDALSDALETPGRPADLPAEELEPIQTEDAAHEVERSNAEWEYVSPQCGIGLPHVPEEVRNGIEGTWVWVLEEGDCSKVNVIVETPHVEEHRTLLWEALQRAGVTEDPPYEVIGRPGGCLAVFDIGEYESGEPESTSCWHQNERVRVWYKAAPSRPFGVLEYNVIPLQPQG